MNDPSVAARHLELKKTKSFFPLFTTVLSVGFILGILLAGDIRGHFCEDDPVVVEVNARAAVIVDTKKGDILYDKNGDTIFPPASTAKVMTAIVAIENLSLDEEIVPGKKVVRIEPTIAGLRPGVKYKLRDLISAILIKSANDAAFVIAEAVAGSEKKFAVMMNEKAKQLGMNNTNFATASGLPTGEKDTQYTTANDLAKMMRYGLRYDVILENMAQKEAYIYGSDDRRIYLKTHNKTLLWDTEAPWGKTGYTKEAKRTFVGMDPSLKPRIVFALLRSTDLWKDIVILKDKGLDIYEQKQKTWFSKLCNWISFARERGKTVETS